MRYATGNGTAALKGTEADFPVPYAVRAGSDIMRHSPYPFDEGRVRNRIKKKEDRYAVFGFGLWALVLKETERVIGACGITMRNMGGIILPRWYPIRKHCQRRGYAKEAARKHRDSAFENIPFDMLNAFSKEKTIRFFP